MMGVWDITAINTTPGSSDSDPFSPPMGFSGNAVEYLHLCRQRWRDVGYAQRMVMAAKYYTGTRYCAKPVVVSGPFRDEAMMIINTLATPAE